MAMSVLGLNFEAPAASFTSKFLKDIASRCEFGVAIKPRPPTSPIYLSHTEMMNIK